MAKTANQKLKPLLLYRYLLEHTDEDHPAAVAQLIAALKERGVSAERKSIYADMELLAAQGLDVQYRKGSNPGWFIGQRLFALSELKLLADAVQSCPFITRRKSDALLRKLERLTSVWRAGQLRRPVHMERRIKAMNESVFHNLDKLHAAIAADRAVTFKYFDYRADKTRSYRRAGRRYTVSPYGLLWDGEHCCLAGYDHAREAPDRYRVDRMDELAVTCLPRQAKVPAPETPRPLWAQEAVLLRCEESLAGTVLDRFGQETVLTPDGAGYFTAAVQTAVTPRFFGWLFALGPGAVILSPDWAAAAYRKRLLAAARQTASPADLAEAQPAAGQT